VRLRNPLPFALVVVCLSFPALLAPLPAAADPLADLRAALQRPAAETPVRARIEVRVTQTQSGDGATRQTVKDATITAEEGPQGLRLGWPAQALADARKAARQRAANPDAKVQDGGLAELDAETAADLLSYAELLLLLLDGATLVEEKNDVRQGRPARLVVFHPAARMDADDRKMLKSREDTVRLWLDPDGTPLELDRTVELKFSKFFITFSVTNKEARTFARAGNRLIVAAETTEGGGSGLGQSGGQKRQVKVTLLP